MKRDPRARPFDLAAASYAQIRPTYPEAAVARVLDRLGLNQHSRVVELGPGPGTWTQLMAERVGHVVAVEPSAEMRLALAAALPTVEVVDGVASDTGLTTGSFDGAVAAQAFHWFQAEPALSEIRRLLVPDSGLAVIYNEKEDDQGVMVELSELVEPLKVGFPSGDRSWVSVLEQHDGFGPIEVTADSNQHVVDQGGLKDLLGTMSFVGGQPDDVRSQLDLDLDRFFERHAQNGRLALHYSTTVTTAIAQ